MSLCQGAAGSRSSKLQLCWGSCKLSDISSECKEPCEKNQGKGYLACNAGFPELSLWDTWCGKKEGGERRGGRKEEWESRAKLPLIPCLKVRDWTFFCCILEKGSHSFMMVEDGGDQETGPSVGEPGWYPCETSDLYKALETITFYIFFLKSLPMENIKLTCMQVNQCHLAGFYQLASNIAIELYLKANMAVLYSFQRGLSGHLK